MAWRVMIIGPADILPDGRQDMCDGCPAMVVFDGELAWSRRLEERMRYGQFVEIKPRGARGRWEGLGPLPGQKITAATTASAEAPQSKLI